VAWEGKEVHKKKTVIQGYVQVGNYCRGLEAERG
jgi:hypothetical protein